MSSTLAAVPSGAFGYDADDRLALDTYDANGNTISSGGNTNVYDFENHLIGQGGAVMVYDGDGNRVKKTVAGVTTTYLVADQNPTGYAQVVSETIAGPGTNRDFRSYAYGLERISQTRNFFNGQNFTQTSFYVYDGHGSVRALTDPSGNVTDTYDYDAFGNLIHTTATGIPPGSTTVGPTPNEFLFAGEQYDSDLHLYYNRARYLNVSTGRFWTMDTFDGDIESPLSLHKYLYVVADPINVLDPSGNQIDEEAEADEISISADSMSDLAYTRVINTFYSILFRVPQIVQAVQLGVTALGAAASAAEVLQQLGHNLLSNTQPYSAVPTARGFQVGQYAGQNLANNFPGIDDFQDGVATQIKSTAQVQTADQLLGVVRSAAQDLNNLPPELTGKTASGQTITIITSADIRVKNLLVVIPSKPYDFDLRAVMEEIQEIANSEKISIALQEVQGLEGP